jgi:hypothetical protein
MYALLMYVAPLTFAIVALFAAIASLFSVGIAPLMIRVEVESPEGTVYVAVAFVMTELVRVTVTVTVLVTPCPVTTKLVRGPANVPVTRGFTGAVGVAVTDNDAGEATAFTTAVTV